MRTLLTLLCLVLLVPHAQARDPWWLRTEYPTTYLPMCKSLGLFQWAMTGPGEISRQGCAVDTYDMDGNGTIDLFDWAEIQVIVEPDAYRPGNPGTQGITACIVQLPPEGCELPPGWPTEEQQGKWGRREVLIETPEIVEEGREGEI